MRTRLRVLPVAVVIGCLAFAGSASAGTVSYAGTVGNGACDTARNVAVSGASRIEVAVSSTAQNNTQVLAEILTPSGQVVGGGSYTQYDTPGSGMYTVRVCANYQLQSPPNLQYSALVGTGVAGQHVLTGPPQPQPATGGVLGATTYLGPVASGKAAILTRSGLAWFTLRTNGNGKMTLRVFDPIHRTTRLVQGLTGTYSGTTLRVSGHGLRLVVRSQNRVTFASSNFKAGGRVVRGHFQIIA